MKWTIRLALLVFLPALTGCSDQPVNFVLKGIWVDTGSPSLQFVEFTHFNQGRFGFIGKNDEHYNSFSYRLLGNQIAINLTSGNASEKLYDFKFESNNEIVIAGLTDLPGDPTKR